MNGFHRPRRTGHRTAEYTQNRGATANAPATLGRPASIIPPNSRLEVGGQADVPKDHGLRGRAVASSGRRTQAVRLDPPHTSATNPATYAPITARNLENACPPRKVPSSPQTVDEQRFICDYSTLSRQLRDHPPSFPPPISSSFSAILRPSLAARPRLIPSFWGYDCGKEIFPGARLA